MTAKKGLLVVSFGTSYRETRVKTIERIEAELAAAFPERRLYRAWTSSMIRKKLKERDQISIFSVAEALSQMADDGLTDILVQPTHIINGTENDLMTAAVAARRSDFCHIAMGKPLLHATEDYFAVIDALAKTYPLPEDTALLLMGHGTEHYTDSAYAALDYMMKAAGHANFFVGTVEGYPDFEAMLHLLKKSPYQKVHLVPLMIVAGDHARHDMVGEDEDSWKNRLTKMGFAVSYDCKGLGEIKEIRDIFLQHAKREEENHV